MAIKFDEGEDAPSQPLHPTAPPPDLIPQQDEARDRLNSERPPDGAESSPARCTRGNKRRKWTFKRAMCCLGWVFCFPVYCACWMLREAPVDEEDIREDDCYPCWS